MSQKLEDFRFRAEKSKDYNLRFFSFSRLSKKVSFNGPINKSIFLFKKGLNKTIYKNVLILNVVATEICLYQNVSRQFS